MDKAIQDATLGTIGWFAFAAAPAGLAAGQTLRLSVVNLGSSDATVLCGLWSNPCPILLAEHKHTLRPGEAVNCDDLKASNFSREIIDKTGRAQIRPFVRSSSRTVCANLEVFDSKSGKTSIILPLQEMVYRE